MVATPSTTRPSGASSPTGPMPPILRQMTVRRIDRDAVTSDMERDLVDGRCPVRGRGDHGDECEWPMSVQTQARALGDPSRHELFRYIVDASRPVDVVELTEHLRLHHNAI